MKVRVCYPATVEVEVEVSEKFTELLDSEGSWELEDELVEAVKPFMKNFSGDYFCIYSSENPEIMLYEE